MTGTTLNRLIVTGISLLLIIIGGCGEMRESSEIASETTLGAERHFDYWILNSAESPDTVTVAYSKDGCQYTSAGKVIPREKLAVVQSIRVTIPPDMDVDIEWLANEFRDLRHATFVIESEHGLQGVPHLYEFLRHPWAKKLESLRIENAHVQPAEMLELTQLPGLTELSLVNCDLDRCCLRALSLLHLRRLRLTSMMIGEQVMMEITPEMLKDEPVVEGGGHTVPEESLGDGYSSLHDTDLEEIGRLPELEELDVGDASLGEQWGRKIGAYYPRLKALDLSRANAESGFIRALGRSGLPVECLVVSDRYTSTIAREELAELSRLHRMRYLDLRSVDVDTQTLTTLMDGMPALRYLRYSPNLFLDEAKVASLRKRHPQVTMERDDP